MKIKQKTIKASGKGATKPTYTLHLRNVGLVSVDADFLDVFINLDSELRTVTKRRMLNNLSDYKAFTNRIRKETTDNFRKQCVVQRFEVRLSLRLLTGLHKKEAFIKCLSTENFYSLS